MQDQVSDLKEVQAAFEICVIFKDLQLTAFMFALSIYIAFVYFNDRHYECGRRHQSFRREYINL